MLDSICSLRCWHWVEDPRPNRTWAAKRPFWRGSGSTRPQHPRDGDRVHARVKTQDYSSLFSSLEQAIEILQRNRTPAPGYIAAYDTLKQARAMIASVVNRPANEQLVVDEERAAA